MSCFFSKSRTNEKTFLTRVRAKKNLLIILVRELFQDFLRILLLPRLPLYLCKCKVHISRKHTSNAMSQGMNELGPLLLKEYLNKKLLFIFFCSCVNFYVRGEQISEWKKNQITEKVIHGVGVMQMQLLSHIFSLLCPLWNMRFMQTKVCNFSYCWSFFFVFVLLLQHDLMKYI